MKRSKREWNLALGMAWKDQNTILKTGTDVNADEAMAVMLTILSHIYTFPPQNNEHFLISLRRAAEGNAVVAPPTVNQDDFKRYFLPGTGEIYPQAARVIRAAVQWRQIEGLEQICLVSPFAEKKIDLEYRRQRIDQLARQLGSKAIENETVNEEPIDRGLPSLDLRKDHDKDLETGRNAVLKNGIRVGFHAAKQVIGWLDDRIHNETVHATLSWEDSLLSLWQLCRGEEVKPKFLRNFMVKGYVDLDGEVDPVVKAVVEATLRWNAKGDVVMIDPFADENDRKEYLHSHEYLERFRKTCFSQDDGKFKLAPPWLKRSDRPSTEKQR